MFFWLKQKFETVRGGENWYGFGVLGALGKEGRRCKVEEMQTMADV